MSEPVTNAQIEDVLSSIRRLVSEDSRSDPQDDAPVQARETTTGSAAEKSDRLVLTPALRVAPPQEQPVPEDVSSEPWTDPSATLFAVTPGDESAPAAADRAPEEAGLDEGIVEDEAEPEETLTFHSARAESLSAKIEELEAVIGRTRDQWEPDGTSADSYSGTPVHPIGWREAEAEASPTPEIAADGLRDVPDAAAGLAADDFPDDMAPAAFDFEGEPIAEPVSGVAADEVPAADEAVLDEDSLRELVAEIVRQELQGALGERITRNVRKLVRREIHRALAAQDLE